MLDYLPALVRFQPFLRFWYSGVIREISGTTLTFQPFLRFWP